MLTLAHTYTHRPASSCYFTSSHLTDGLNVTVLTLWKLWLQAGQVVAASPGPCSIRSRSRRRVRSPRVWTAARLTLAAVKALYCIDRVVKLFNKVL